MSFYKSLNLSDETKLLTTTTNFIKYTVVHEMQEYHHVPALLLNNGGGKIQTLAAEMRFQFCSLALPPRQAPTERVFNQSYIP